GGHPFAERDAVVLRGPVRQAGQGIGVGFIDLGSLGGQELDQDVSRRGIAMLRDQGLTLTFAAFSMSIAIWFQSVTTSACAVAAHTVKSIPIVVRAMRLMVLSQ